MDYERTREVLAAFERAEVRLFLMKKATVRPQDRALRG